MEHVDTGDSSRSAPAARRVAIVVPSITGGGAEHVSSKWAAALNEAGFKVDIVTTHEQKIIDFGNGHTTPLNSGSSGILRSVFSLKRMPDQGKYDALISVMTFSNLLCLMSRRLARGSCIPLIISEHTLHSHRRPEYRLRMRVQQRLARTSYKRAEAWIAPSHAVGAEMVTAYKLENSRMWIVPNPVAVSGSINRNDQNNLRTSAAPIKLLFVGRLVPAKRPQLLLEIAKRIAEEHTVPVSISFIGDGPMRVELERQAVHCAFPVEFLGWQERWYEHCGPGSVLIVTSPIEGLGNVLIEAASVGIPSVVSSRCLGGADACIPGVTAALIPDDSVKAFAMAAVGVTPVPLSVTSKWLQRFTVEATANVFGDIIETVCRSNGSVPNSRHKL